MRRATILAMVVGLCWAGMCRGQQVLSVATAQDVTAQRVMAAGRLRPVVSARLSPRVSGQLVALGTDKEGRPLDAGMLVIKGQMLFHMEDTTYANRVAETQARLASATASLANLKAKLRPERLEQLQQAVAELDLRVANQVKDVERYQRLVEVDKTLPVKRLDDAALELATLQSQRKAAQARLEEAVNGATATEVALAEAQVKEAEVAVKIAQQDQQDTVMAAPFDGMITQRFKSAGDFLASTPPTEVMEVVSLEELEVEFRLPEAYLGRVEAGKSAVKLSSPLLEGTLNLKVTRIIREIDPSRGTFACRTSVRADQRQGLIPGASVAAELELGEGIGEVVVPQRGVLIEEGKTVVYVAENGVMKRRPVVVGDRLSEGVLIQSGVRDGERIVVGPAEMLKDGRALPEYLQPSAVPPAPAK